MKIVCTNQNCDKIWIFKVLSSPNLVIDHFVFKYFQGCDLIENLRLAELHQVVDDHIRDPQILKAKMMTGKRIIVE